MYGFRNKKDVGSKKDGLTNRNHQETFMNSD